MLAEALAQAEAACSGTAVVPASAAPPSEASCNSAEKREGLAVHSTTPIHLWAPLPVLAAQALEALLQSPEHVAVSAVRCP